MKVVKTRIKSIRTNNVSTIISIISLNFSLNFSASRKIVCFYWYKVKFFGFYSCFFFLMRFRVYSLNSRTSAQIWWKSRAACLDYTWCERFQVQDKPNEMSAIGVWTNFELGRTPFTTKMWQWLNWKYHTFKKCPFLQVRRL